MSEVGNREWRFYLDDMIDFAERIVAYTKGLDQTAFEANPLVFDATLRNLELIGEAGHTSRIRCGRPTRKSRGA